MEYMYTMANGLLANTEGEGGREIDRARERGANKAALQALPSNREGCGIWQESF